MFSIQGADLTNQDFLFFYLKSKTLKTIIHIRCLFTIP